VDEMNTKIDLWKSLTVYGKQRLGMSNFLLQMTVREYGVKEVFDRKIILTKNDLPNSVVWDDRRQKENK
jgi:hypothetical protein